MTHAWESMLNQWSDAGLVNPDTVSRIRQWQALRQPSDRSSHLAALAFSFGALLLLAGALLFVSAHWQAMPNAARFALLLATVIVFHGSAALASTPSPRLATALHAVGTGALGAGLFLAAQIFNLEEHWPAGLLLWALGAGCGLALLRDWPHVLWVASLVPAWLWGEWSHDLRSSPNLWHQAAPLVGSVLLAWVYMASEAAASARPWRRVLSRLGSLALLPAAILLICLTTAWPQNGLRGAPSPVPLGWGDLLSWAVALVGPWALALVLRGVSGVGLTLVLAWCLVTMQCGWGSGWGSLTQQLAVYSLCTVGALGLTVWGVRSLQQRAVNLGIWAFALTLVCFYFSNVADRLGRSLSLLIGGVCLLLGGWLLERFRRHLIRGLRGVHA